jgi:hypothetical protein
MSAIEGQFVTFKHISTRGVIQMVIEAPETSAPEVFAHLGYPRSGESLYVAVVRLCPPDERVVETHHKELEMNDTSPETLNALLTAKMEEL